MRKVSISLLISVAVGLSVCLMVSESSQAAESDKPAADGVLNLHPNSSARPNRARRAAGGKSGIAATARAMPHRFAALVNPPPTQPDIAGPPPASQMPASPAPASQPPASQPSASRLPGAAAQPSGPSANGKSAPAEKGGPAQNAGKARDMSAAVAEHKAREFAALPREVRQFCVNTANAAANARIAWQAARLTELSAKLRQRIAQLEAKRAEYEDWLHRHDEAMQEARKDVVAIYSRMRPDAAASQLSVMDEVMAASLLTKLNARVASAILAEMDPGRAARIANAMLGPPIPADGKKS